MLVFQSAQHNPFLCPQLFLCTPKGSGELSCPCHSTHSTLTGISQPQRGCNENRLWPHTGLLAPSPYPLDVSPGASAAAINFALKHFKLELKPEKVQPVASDSSSPAKVRAVLVRSCLLKPPPPPDPCSGPQAPAPIALPLLTHSPSAQPLEMEKLHTRTLLLTVSTRGP